MTKRKAAYTVNEDLSGIFSKSKESKSKKKESISNGYPIEKALAVVIRQMKISGYRERTIFDYQIHVNDFIKVTGVKYIEDVTALHIYEWLASMDVSNQTKLTRLKCLKAFLGKCIFNGWITVNFWNDIKIKVSSPVKEAATDRDIELILSLLDLTRFVELRDATAILLMYQTGIRVGTLSKLQDKNVDFDNKLLIVDGDIVKNYQPIFLPFDDTLHRLLKVLINQNDLIRNERKVKNEYLFITQNGDPVSPTLTNNNITKRLKKYSKEYGIKNINPHALRRGFAKNLLNKGANIALISKALGHSDIAVTTRYLHLDNVEVAENLRKFL